jgi:hypothetical protein
MESGDDLPQDHCVFRGSIGGTVNGAVLIRQISNKNVGWVERSETHHVMGIATLHPSYKKIISEFPNFALTLC